MIQSPTIRYSLLSVAFIGPSSRERLRSGTMHILFFSVILTCVAFAMHWIVWRVRIPVRQTRAMLGIFTAVGVAAAMIGVSGREPLSAWWPATGWEWLHAMTFYVAVMLGYVVVYTAIEERSPSMTLLSFAARNPTQGSTRLDLESVLGGASPVEVRLDALIRDRMVAERDDICTLTEKGRRWATTFELLRRLLGFPTGG